MQAEVSEWKAVKLGGFVTLQRGHDLPMQSRKPGSIPIIGSFGVTGHHDTARAPGPGVTIGRSGASFGVVSYSSEPFWPLNTALYVVDFHGNDERFAYYFLKQFDFTRYNSGSAQPSLNRNFIHPIPVRVPPIGEQRRIADILGTLDDNIELNRRMGRTLEAIARAIFKSWFVDFDPVHAKAEGRHPVGMTPETAALFPDGFQDSPLGKIPKGWEVGSLGGLCEKPQYGYTESAIEEPVGPRFLRITDINKQPWIEWETVPYCKIDHASHEKYRLALGDVVIARIADPGHAAYIEEDVDAVFASYLIRFRLLDRVYGRYVQHWLKSSDYWNLVRARRSGSTRGNLNARVLSGFPILVPPVDLAERFRVAIEPLAKKLTTLVGESQSLSETRDTLLPRLLSGGTRLAAIEDGEAND